MHGDSEVLRQRLEECAVTIMDGSVDECVTQTTKTFYQFLRSAKQAQRNAEFNSDDKLSVKLSNEKF